MRIPGFTADAAVLPVGHQYEMAGTFEAAGKATVAPQACVNLGPCKVCVDVKFGLPPRACVNFSCFGFSKSLCVP